MSTEDRTPVASVIVPASNAQATLGRTLAALSAQDLEDEFEVVVVDDGSTDGTAAIVENWGPPVRLARTSTRQGPGQARNVGVATSRAQILAFTDADCFPRPAWLREGLRTLASADLVQGAVEPDPSVRRGPFDRTLEVRGDQGYYETANLFVRRSVFEAVGGFSDWVLERPKGRPLRLGSPRTAVPSSQTVGEDVLFGWQAHRLGARTRFARDALVHHAVFPMTPYEWIRYRWRWSRHMPALPGRIPELRDQAFYHRWFFDWRSSRFDLALLGLAAAGWWRRPWPLIAALPYARFIHEEAAVSSPSNRLVFVLASVAGDAATLLGLAVGSAVWRAPLL